MSNDSEYWATDSPISFPEPPPDGFPVLESFGAFGFAMSGMVHDITPADLEDLTTPMFAPEGFRGLPYTGPVEGKGPRMEGDD